MGTTDRIVRVLIGIGMLCAMAVGHGPQRWFGPIGVVPLLTAVVRFCPLYTALGVGTSSASTPGP